MGVVVGVDGSIVGIAGIVGGDVPATSALHLLPFARVFPQSAGRTIEHATLMTHDAALKVDDAEAKMEELYQFWDQARTGAGWGRV